MGNLNYIVYPGNKTRFLPDILELIEKVKKPTSILIEPFAGSGTVSLHAPANKIILNDKDYYIFKIHEAFKNGIFIELKEIIDEIWAYGDPRNIKEDYYKGRDELNKKYLKTSLGNKEGFYYWAISTFAINSMMRFGPNGFNQGWGHRGIGRNAPTKRIKENKFDKIKKSYEQIELRNEDYQFIKEFNNENSICFMDPPYIERESGTYSFTDEDYLTFLNLIKEWKGPVIYTDVFSVQKIENLGQKWDYKIIRKTMGSGKPGVGSGNMEEAIYINFKLTKSKKLF